MDQAYAVFDEDFQVAVMAGEQIRHWEPKEAARLALYLLLGASAARAAGNLLTPWRYGIPGDDQITPDVATQLAWEMFGQAAALEMIGGTRVEFSRTLAAS